MGSDGYCIMNAVLIGVVLNIVLPMALIPFATEEEKNPPSGAAALPPKSQFMHMMVHHNQVPVMSSLIVALMVGLAVYLGYVLEPIEKVVQLMK
jgi:predicted secreted protein